MRPGPAGATRNLSCCLCQKNRAIPPRIVILSAAKNLSYSGATEEGFLVASLFWSRGLSGNNRNVRPHLVEFLTADSVDGQQILDAFEWAALLAE